MSIEVIFSNIETVIIMLTYLNYTIFLFHVELDSNFNKTKCLLSISFN